MVRIQTKTEKPDFSPQDVWDWPGRRYRLRTASLLLFDVLLFAGLGLFTFWLRTGHVYTPSYPNYWGEFTQTFSPSHDTGITPVSLLERPIDVVDVPSQGVVLGLLLAALAAIPILVSILYRFPASIPFILVVGFLAMMPWLALVLTASCALASLKPFRRASRFASALLALLPLILYLIFASLQTTPAVELTPGPADRIKHVLPLVFALVAACILFAVALTLSKLVNFRPGAVAPVLAAMFAIPVLVFEYHVGRDELYYRLLESRWKRAFVDGDLRPAGDTDLRDQVIGESRLDLAELEWEMTIAGNAPLARNVVLQLALEVVDDAKRFVKYFPQSRYAVNAYYIMATSLDTRVDTVELEKTGRLIHYVDYPSEKSHHAWEMVLANAPESPMAAVARLRLAQLDARAGRVDQAIHRLRDLLPSAVDASTTPAELAAAPQFSPQPFDRTLQVPLNRTFTEARQFLDLLQSNRDPLYGDAPLTGRDATGDHGIGLLRLDPGDGHYVENLQRLMKRYPKSLLRDNIELTEAMQLSDPAQRVGALEDCLKSNPNGDAVPEVLFRLAEARSDLGEVASARQTLNQLIARFPGSLWADSAEDRLRQLPPIAASVRREESFDAA